MKHSNGYEERFYALLENVPNMAVQGYMANGTVLYWNKASERLYGYTAEEALGRNLLDLIIPDEIREEVRQAIYIMGEKGEAIPASELTLRRKDGSLVTVFSSHSVVSRQDGTKEFFCMDIDISEQRKSHTELAKANDRNKALLDAIPDMIFVFDNNGVIIDYHYHREHDHDLYVPPSDFLHRRVDDVLPAHLGKLTHEKIQEVLTGGKPAIANYELFFQGETRHYESRYVQCGEHEVLSIVRNITESKKSIERVEKSEEKHRKLQQLFRNMVDIMPDMLWAKDLDKNYIFVNQSICRNLLNAKDIHEPIGKNDMYFATRERESHPENPEWHTFGEICRDSDAIVLKTMKTGQFDEYGNVKGRFLFLDVIKTPLKDELGQVIGVVGTARDVTAYKDAEKKLIEAKIKAEESDKLKTAFINNISHEIRTPLNGILGFGHVMAYTNLSEKERQAYYQILQRSANRLMQTVTDYMDISMISTLSIKQNKQFFDLNELMLELFEKTREVVDDKKVQVKLDVPDESENLKVLIDRELLRKVLYHLLHNSQKFTSTGAIIFGYRHLPGEIRFFVSDTGSGITSDKLDDIFDVFIQEDTAMTRGYEGSGLGLAIVKGIVSLMGGSVQVESEKGKGSSFLVTIPCEVVHPGKGQTKQQKTESGQTRHRLLLVVEDIDTDYKFLRIMLANEGYRSLHANNGLEAVEICKQYSDISLVLMDIKLPVMDGVQATRLIKELRSGLPVIGISAYAGDGQEHKAKQAGCDDFIPKPVHRDLLIKTVRKYLPD
jgi:PAS domain S-box-containing protein